MCRIPTIVNVRGRQEISFKKATSCNTKQLILHKILSRLYYIHLGHSRLTVIEIVLYCIRSILPYIIIFFVCSCMYCIALHCIVLYCIVLHCIVLFCIVLCCVVLYCIVLYCIVLIVLCCTVLFCIVTLIIVNFPRFCIQPHFIQRKISLSHVMT